VAAFLQKYDEMTIPQQMPEATMLASILTEDFFHNKHTYASELNEMKVPFLTELVEHHKRPRNGKEKFLLKTIKRSIMKALLLKQYYKMEDFSIEEDGRIRVVYCPGSYNERTTDKLNNMNDLP
jgi:hypothetical protein